MDENLAPEPVSNEQWDPFRDASPVATEADSPFEAQVQGSLPEELASETAEEQSSSEEGTPADGTISLEESPSEFSLEEPEAEEEAAPQPTPAKEPKKISLDNNGEKISVDPAAKLSHRVDGKDVQLTFQELLEGYSGNQSNIANYKKFQAEKAQLEADISDFSRKRDDFKARTETFLKKAQEGDFFNAIVEFMGSEDSDLDVVSTKVALRDALIEPVIAWASMSDAEKDLLIHKEKAHHYEERAKKLREEQQKASSQQQFQLAVQKAMKENEISSIDEFKLGYEDLTKSKEAGLYTGEITPESVGQFVAAKNRTIAKIGGIIGSVNKDAAKDPKVFSQVWNGIEHYVERHGQFPPEDLLRESVKKYLANDKGSKAKQKGTSSASAANSKGKSPNPFDWESI